MFFNNNNETTENGYEKNPDSRGETARENSFRDKEEFFGKVPIEIKIAIFLYFWYKLAKKAVLNILTK